MYAPNAGQSAKVARRLGAVLAPPAPAPVATATTRASAPIAVTSARCLISPPCSSYAAGTARRHTESLRRVGGLPRARRLHARRLSGHLREVRRIRRLPHPLRLVALDPLEQHLEVADDVVDPCLDVAEPRETLLHRDEREVLGLDVGELVPRDRRGDGRVGARPNRVRGRNRAVARVLVVVDEDLLAPLLLPPGRRHEVRCPLLDLPRECEGATAHDRELPARLDPHRDVDP